MRATARYQCEAPPKACATPPAPPTQAACATTCKAHARALWLASLEGSHWSRDRSCIHAVPRPPTSLDGQPESARPTYERRRD